MSNLWINIRIGTRHLQIGPDTFRFNVNGYFRENKPLKFIEVYQFFSYHGPDQ